MLSIYLPRQSGRKSIPGRRHYYVRGPWGRKELGLRSSKKALGLDRREWAEQGTRWCFMGRRGLFNGNVLLGLLLIKFLWFMRPAGYSHSTPSGLLHWLLLPPFNLLSLVPFMDSSSSQPLWSSAVFFQVCTAPCDHDLPEDLGQRHTSMLMAPPLAAPVAISFSSLWPEYATNSNSIW